MAALLRGRAAVPHARQLPGLAASALQRRCYQGNLQDKDRIFTNLYNDSSPFLDGAKKRVRACQALAQSRGGGARAMAGRPARAAGSC